MAIPEIEPVAISINNHYATSISEQTSPLLVAASDTSDTKIDGSGSPPSLNNPSNSRLGAEISKILSMHSSLENMSQAAAASSKNNIILNTSPSYSKIPKTSSASSLHQSQKDLNLSSSSSSTSPLQIPKIHPSVSDSQVSKMEEIGEVDKDSSSLAVAAAVANNDSFSFRDMLKMEQDEEVGKQHGKAQNNHQKHLNPIATKPNSLPASSKSSRPASDTLSDDMKFSPEKISSPPSSKSSEKMNSVGSTSSSSSSPFALLGEAVKKLSETGRRFSMSAAATRMRDQQQQSIIPSTQLGAQTTGPTTKSGNIMDEELIAPLEHTLAAMQAVSATGQKSVTGSLNLLNSSEVGGFVLGPSSGTTTETSAPFSWSSSNSPTSAAGALSPGILNEQLSSSVGSNAVRLAGGVQW